jgi:hypothetical protein
LVNVVVLVIHLDNYNVVIDSLYPLPG